VVPDRLESSQREGKYFEPFQFIAIYWARKGLEELGLLMLMVVVLYDGRPGRRR